MVLVPAGAENVVPGRRLMAVVTLLDPGMRFTGDAGGNHLEVFHVMRGRCLVALGAVGRTWRRMPEFRNRPFIRRVAFRAIPAEELEMAVVIRMARCTIQNGFRR